MDGEWLGRRAGVIVAVGLAFPVRLDACPLKDARDS
jgi:hypothetical protein